ncbi:hypothetical protein PISMIDRAFT_685665 [Pisolithus microcarpus 441]|uniref:Uncharacterized protein n=1 Tax=Pisolithus microcarpus 441 TaxID=765257 RepID=A0A0C9XXA5_9AGAM|nr:hypothetical protein PISMIDRAFT_685665 [Pisolithus microcarpus 441]
MESTEVFASCRRAALMASYTHERLLAAISSKQDDSYPFQGLGLRTIFSQSSRRDKRPSTLPAEKMGSREELMGNEDRRHIISSTRSTKSRARDMSWGLKLPRVRDDNLKGAELGSPESKSEGRTLVILAMTYPGGQT